MGGGIMNNESFYHLQTIVKSFVSVRDKVFELFGIKGNGVKNRHQIINRIIKEAVVREGNRKVVLGSTAAVYVITDEVKNLLMEYVKRQKEAAEIVARYLKESGVLRWLCSNYGFTMDEIEDIMYECLYKILDKIKDTPSMLVYIMVWLKTDAIRRKKFEEKCVRFSDMVCPEDEDYVNEDNELRVLFKNLSDVDREKFVVRDAETVMISKIDRAENFKNKRKKVRSKIEEIYRKRIYKESESIVN